MSKPVFPANTTQQGNRGATRQEQIEDGARDTTKTVAGVPGTSTHHERLNNPRGNVIGSEKLYDNK